MIPNVIHFIFGLSADFGGRPFGLIHYMAVRSAYESNRPDKIYFHHCHEPGGEWWEKAKPYLEMVKVTPPTHIFGNPLLHYAHVADVLRLEALLKYGGIYLDIDVLCLKSFAPLRRYETVMGHEGGGEGLCNAVILAAPGATFISRWYDTYRTFRSTGKTHFWNEHSVQKPLELAREIPESIHSVNRFAFFWPHYHHFPLLFGVAPHRPAAQRAFGLMAQPVSYLISKQLSYCVHLYESLWWDKYLKDLTPERIRTMHRSFGWLFRKYLPDED